MKKSILFSIIVFQSFVLTQAQIYTPIGTIFGTTVNPTTGNVGVGTNNPLFKLDVNGRLRVNIPGFQHSTIIIGNDANDNNIEDNSANKYYGGGYFFRVLKDYISYKYIDVMALAENFNVGIVNLTLTSILDVYSSMRLAPF